jgi:hypothetical protein
MIEKPTFLIGPVRAGTTLLRLMLSYHPEYAPWNEFPYSVDFLADWPDAWPPVAAYHAFLAEDRHFAHIDQYAIDPALDYPALVDSFLVQCRERAGRPRVGACVHRHFDQVLRIWPDARFIYMVRDGRDVARSCIAMGWAANVWKAAEFWTRAEESWKRLRERLTPDRYTEIKYEDLILNTEAELARLCTFLGVAYDPAMLSYADATTYDRPDPRLVQQWRKKYAEADLRVIEARIGPLLAERGYELSGLPPLTLGPWTQARLWADNRLGMFRRNVRFLGPRLWFLELATRRLGLKGLHARYRGEVHALVNATVK